MPSKRDEEHPFYIYEHELQSNLREERNTRLVTLHSILISGSLVAVSVALAKDTSVIGKLLTFGISAFLMVVALFTHVTVLDQDYAAREIIRDIERNKLHVYWYGSFKSKERKHKEERALIKYLVPKYEKLHPGHIWIAMILMMLAIYSAGFTMLLIRHFWSETLTFLALTFAPIVTFFIFYLVTALLVIKEAKKEDG
ncbi:MAG: hypothetical protein M1503_09470 [Thaumarchaeota archaeon]|nr:hypothetical protein [Nitrososphaerota archaeon]MCL5318467.1 hypothetical protein [Nitrososphaerota archaeon]